MTVRDLIRNSMRLVGAISTGEDVSADEAADGLACLNDLLDSWSTEGAMITAQKREVFSLVANQASYTVGTGLNFSTLAPLKVLAAAIIPAGTNPAYELPLDILSQGEWQEVKIKSLATPLPTKIYIESLPPVYTIYLNPVPSVVSQLVLYSLKPLTSFASVNDTIAMNPGYTRALRYNLAVELALEYGREINPKIDATALKLKAQIMRNNSDDTLMESDYPTQGKPYNWLTGN